VPKALLLAGGSGPALRYQYYLDNTPVDGVILAEGEFTLKQLCEDKHWEEVDGVVFKKKAKISRIIWCECIPLRYPNRQQF
jgi:radical SAM superfamily enzyme YgiQ (UPF0313 family)